MVKAVAAIPRRVQEAVLDLPGNELSRRVVLLRGRPCVGDRGNPGLGESDDSYLHGVSIKRAAQSPAWAITRERPCPRPRTSSLTECCMRMFCAFMSPILLEQRLVYFTDGSKS